MKKLEHTFFSLPVVEQIIFHLEEKSIDIAARLEGGGKVEWLWRCDHPTGGTGTFISVCR